MNNKCEKGLQNIDKLYAKFRKVANVLFFRRKTRVKDNWKEKFTAVQLQANQHLSLQCMNDMLNVCKGSVEKKSSNEYCEVLTV